jgi:hypothetical protein
MYGELLYLSADTATLGSDQSADSGGRQNLSDRIPHLTAGKPGTVSTVPIFRSRGEPESKTVLGWRLAFIFHLRLFYLLSILDDN